MLLHLFQRLALGFGREFCHKEETDDSKCGVNQVGWADTNPVFTGENREGSTDQKVCNPLGKPAYGNGYGTNAVVEHFSEHYPHDRAPGGREEGHVEVCCNECNNASGVGKDACFGTEEEAEGECAECDGHACRTNQEQRLATYSINQKNGDDSHD